MAAATPDEAFLETSAFVELDPGQRRLLAAIARHGQLASGEIVYREGAAGGDFLLVAEGTLEARRETPMGVQRVATLAAGDLVGEISILDGRPRSTSVVATGESRVWRFEGGDFTRLLASEPALETALLRYFCRSLAAKIRQANGVMSEIMAASDEAAAAAGAVPGERHVVADEAKRRLLADQGVSGPELDELTSFLEGHRFASGTPIFREGESGETLYIVAEGAVRISRRIPGMGEEAIAILGPGEVFGEMAWLDASPRSADAIAHTGGCTLLAISNRDLDGTIGARQGSSSEFLKLICQVLCRRIRAMNDQLVAYRTMAWF